MFETWNLQKLKTNGISNTILGSSKCKCFEFKKWFDFSGPQKQLYKTRTFARHWRDSASPRMSPTCQAGVKVWPVNLKWSKDVRWKKNKPQGPKLYKNMMVKKL